MAHEITLTSRGKFAAPRRALSLVHSSDVHVGEFTEPLHKGDGTAGLRVVLAAARAAKADAVILAGDTFEHNRLAAPLLDRAAALLADAAMPVVILPGNHDPAIADSVFHRAIAAPDNVHVLGVTDEAMVSFPDLALDIWGNAHRDYGDNAPLATAQKRRSFWHVAVAHGHHAPVADRSTPLRPGWLIGDDELVAAGADYIALGHWNRFVRVGGDNVAAYYSGSPDYAMTVNLVTLSPEGTVTVERARVDWD
jgi:DNA repair exonuclease SbcCD nuclease subunit